MNEKVVVAVAALLYVLNLLALVLFGPKVFPMNWFTDPLFIVTDLASLLFCSWILVWVGGKIAKRRRKAATS